MSMNTDIILLHDDFTDLSNLNISDPILKLDLTVIYNIESF